MNKNILVLGRVGAKFSYKICNELADYFEDASITAYLLGPANSNRVSRYNQCRNIDRILYDFKIGSERPENPNIDYLREFEDQHGRGELWKCIFSDRKLSKNAVGRVFHDDTSPYAHSNILSHVEARARALESLFEETKFDFVFGQQIGFLGGMISCSLARSHGIPFYRMGPARIKNKFILLEDVLEKSPQTRNLFEIAKKNPEGFAIGEAKSYVQGVQNGEPLYSIKSPPTYDSKQNRSLYDKSFGRIARLLADGIDTEYYADTALAKIYVQKAKKYLNHLYYQKSNTFDDFEPDKNYVYFPLQVQPEQSLMIWARYHTELPEVVKNIAQSVPIGTEVFVKEHPNMIGARKKSYYNNLRKLPNVRVLPTETDSNLIIRNAIATVCITSSVGFQSVINKTPAITLAEPGYAMMDTVRTVSDYDELPRVIYDCRSSEVDVTEVVLYVAACLEAGIDRDDPEFAKKVCRLIKNSQLQRHE